MPQLSRSLSLTVEHDCGLTVPGVETYEIVNAKRLGVSGMTYSISKVGSLDYPSSRGCTSDNNKNNKPSSNTKGEKPLLTMSKEHRERLWRASPPDDEVPGPTPSPTTRLSSRFVEFQDRVDADEHDIANDEEYWSEKPLPFPQQNHKEQHNHSQEEQKLPSHRHRHHHHSHNHQFHHHHHRHSDRERTEEKGSQMSEQSTTQSGAERRDLSTRQEGKRKQTDSPGQDQPQQCPVQNRTSDINPLALEAINSSISGVAFADLRLYVVNENNSVYANSAILKKACPALVREYETYGELRLDTMEGLLGDGMSATAPTIQSALDVSPLNIGANAVDAARALESDPNLPPSVPKGTEEAFENQSSEKLRTASGLEKEITSTIQMPAGRKDKESVEELSKAFKKNHKPPAILTSRENTEPQSGPPHTKSSDRALAKITKRIRSGSSNPTSMMDQMMRQRTENNDAHSQKPGKAECGQSSKDDAEEDSSLPSSSARMPSRVEKVLKGMQASDDNVITIPVHGCCTQTLRALIFYFYTSQVRFHIVSQEDHDKTAQLDASSSHTSPPPTRPQGFKDASVERAGLVKSGRLMRTFSMARRNLSSPTVTRIINVTPEVARTPGSATSQAPALSQSVPTSSDASIPPQMSPHSACCIALAFNLETLRNLAFDHLVESIHPRTALSEFLSPFALRFPTYQDMVLRFLKYRWAEVKKHKETSECLAKLARGGFPQAQQALLRLFAELDISRAALTPSITFTASATETTEATETTGAGSVATPAVRAAAWYMTEILSPMTEPPSS